MVAVVGHGVLGWRRGSSPVGSFGNGGSLGIGVCQNRGSPKTGDQESLGIDWGVRNGIWDFVLGVSEVQGVPQDRGCFGTGGPQKWGALRNEGFL